MKRILQITLLTILFCFSLHSAIIYVDDDASGTNDGSSWTNAFSSLQSALDAAVSSDAIWVATGNYKPSQEADGTTDTPRLYCFMMKPDVEIYGGFAGNEDPATFDLDDRDYTSNESTLNGDLGADDDFNVDQGGYQDDDTGDDTGDENCYHVIYNRPNFCGTLTRTAILDGFAITGGNANGYMVSPEYGGGIYNDYGISATFRNLIVKNSSARLGGGGIYNGTYSADTNPLFSNVTVTCNYTSGNGGGIYNYNADVIMTNATITYNYAAEGGGIHNYHGGTYDLTDVTIANNHASGYGGGIRNYSVSGEIKSATIKNNISGDAGGGILNYTGTHNFYNVLFCGNTAIAGGGLYLWNGSTNLYNATITGNDASTSGGGVRITSGSSASLNNCIVWGNTAVDGNELYSYGTPTLNYSCYSNGTNDIYDGGTLTATNHNITSDPCFVGSENNADHPYSIGGISPCCDTGDDSYNNESYDVRGENYQRKLNKTTGGIGTIDMGAYEYLIGSDVPLPVTLTSFSGKINNGTIELSWETASETENRCFHIYRNNEMIAEIEGAGTSSKPHQYLYSDNEVIPGKSYTYVLADVRFSNKETKYTDKAVIITIPAYDIPEEFSLGDNTPNPFNPVTMINYQLSANSDIELSIYDMNGKKITTLVNDHISAGYHKISWDASGYSSGVYLYRLNAQGLVETKKMVLLK